MEFLDRLLDDSGYNLKLNMVKGYEADRIYCKHDLEHSKEVARILTSLAEEFQLEHIEDIAIPMAYLHDIGRCDSYEDPQVFHDKASGQYADDLLHSYHYDEELIEIICYGIVNHSGRMPKQEIEDYLDSLREICGEVGDNPMFLNNYYKNTWAKLLQIADQLSRACYDCKASDTCKWSIEERNTARY